MHQPQPELCFRSASFLHDLYAVSYMWVAAIGFVVTMVTGVIVSRATGGNDILDKELFSSWVHPRGMNIAADNLCAEKVGMGFISQNTEASIFHPEIMIFLSVMLVS